MRTIAIIPALNEAHSIGKVLAEIPRPLIAEIIVSDNGSTDQTAEIARSCGARVVEEPQRGYGAACLRALAHLDESAEVVLFLDGDYSDYPAEAAEVLRPILAGQADMVIGSRALGECEAGALTPQQRFGNGLATWLMWLLWRQRYTDLGPFRAIRRDALDRLRMEDRNYGWTIEMQIKAVRAGLRIAEVPVRYRKRIGQSKISGTLSGSFNAGRKILYCIAKYWLEERFPKKPRTVENQPCSNG
ncbi:MAG: glycosyltransferase family 2 protein [Blastocatellia bacterium]|nr:glycosyltransferase family 2 protein [Blastocatellia bacterium]